MSINPFKLEEYLAKYEFSAPYLLCCSDAETFSMHEILHMASKHEIDLWNNLRLGYTEVQGLPLLREQIATSLYPKLESNNVLCFAGAEEGIFCALHVLCNPGDHVIVLTPCYQSLVEIPRLKGADVSEILLQEKNEWRIDLIEIEKHIKQNTKCIVINFPHNPTGQVITQQELLQLINLCERHNLWLFSDEVYRLLGCPNEPWASSAAEIYPKAISLGVMSKTFGMAGLRLGWISCQNHDMLQKIAYMKHYTSICNSAPSEIISLIALRNKEQILSRNNKIVADNLRLLDEFMKEFSSIFEWVRPQGGCVGFVKFKKLGSIDAFSSALVKEKGVLIMPCSIYDYNGNYFRLGFGRKNMFEALGKLKEFLLNYDL